MGIDIDMESTPENGIMTTGEGGADDGGGVHRRGNVENGDRETVSYLSKLAAVDIEFNDLTYTLSGLDRDSNIILRGISGQFKSGELTAILGPSGAGKSTLLNILAGYKTTHIGGTININDQPRDIQKFRKMSCYIMQDDLVQPKLTVFEAMSFAADLKLGKRKSQSEKRIVINNILSVLRLSTKQETITEKLSGGERKRLVIALELVDNPPIIFLDEPTTGLDELSSSICVNVLQRLAHFGRTVICSVHTPSSSTFYKFDHVYVLSAGQCTYRGTASNLVPFLKSINLECPKHYNPADFVIEISSGDYGFDQLEKMIAFVDTKLPISPISQTVHAFELEQNNPKVSWNDQFNTLVRRMLLQLYRNRNYMYLKASLQIFLGLIIGTLFWNMGNDGSKVLFNFGFCFACLIVFLYIPMLPILLHFPMEISIMKREYFNRWYTLNAYYWALTIINIPQQMLLGFTYLPIVYISTGQPLEWDRCLMFFGTCFLCSFIAESIGYSIASTLNVVNSVFVGPALCCPLILLAIQNFGSSTDLPMYRTIFMYTSYIRYGLEALVLSMYGYNRKTLPCPLEEVYCHFNSPKEVFRSILGCKSMPNFWINISSLIIILLICKGMLYYLLRQRLKPNRTFQMLRLVRRIVKNHLNI